MLMGMVGFLKQELMTPTTFKIPGNLCQKQMYVPLETSRLLPGLFVAVILAGLLFSGSHPSEGAALPGSRDWDGVFGASGEVATLGALAIQ
jgi:hypothetical protein